jgi:hypothetical protein
VRVGDIEDRKTLKAWFESQPRQVSVLIAARAALRTLPLFSAHAHALGSRDVSSLESAPRRFADLAGALFRATALARVAGTYPTRANALSARDAVAASDAAASHAAGSTDAYAAYAATYAAASHAASSTDAYAAYAATYAADAADAAGNVAAGNASDAAGYASDAADAGASGYSGTARDALWTSVRADALAIEGDGVQALLRSRLWMTPSPGWAIRAFGALREALPKAENWDVWYKWYDDRLNGVVYDEPRDFVFATVPTKVWDQGSAAANAWIWAKLEKLDDSKAGEGKPEVLSLEDKPDVLLPEAEEDRPETLSVLFSYAWQPMEAQQRAQIELFERLSHLVDQKPPEFAALPRIELWRDVERLEHSHGANAQIAAACNRAFLILSMVSLKYATSEGCMMEFDRFVDAQGTNLPGKAAIPVAVNCRAADVDRRFSAGLRLWMDDDGRTLVESMRRSEAAKDRFTKKIARQIFLAARRHLGGAPDTDIDDSVPEPPPPKPRRQTLAERLKPLDEQPSPVELIVGATGKIAEVEQWPAIVATPGPRGEDDREKLQDLCRKAASDLANDIAKGFFGKFRDRYLVLTLERYGECVPSSNFTGNILRADLQAKLLSRLCVSTHEHLPTRVADALGLVIDEHKLLRVFFFAPAASDAFIEQVGDAPPPSPERLAEIPEALDHDASDAFEPGAKESIKESFQSDSPAPAGASPEETRNIQGARAYLILTTLNRLVKVLDVGSKANGAINLAKQTLYPIIERLLNDWLPHWPNWPW